MARLTYESVHWGDTPTDEVDSRYAWGPAKIIGEIESLSYATRKEGKWSVWQHDFEPHDGRGPYLMRVTRGTTRDRIPNPGPDQTIEIGQLVDVILKDGQRVVFSGASVATTPDGRELLIVSPKGTPYQIERRSGAHSVTDAGIEG